MENQVLDSDFILEKKKTKAKWAGFWIRVLASLIDFVAYLPLVGLSIYNLNSMKSLPIQLSINLLLIVYKPFMEFKYGATLGKMAVGVKVVNKDLEQVSLSQAIIRYIPLGVGQLISLVTGILVFQHPDFDTTYGWLEVGTLQNEFLPEEISQIASLFALVSCIVVGLAERKQGVHDMIAGTYCVYKNP